MLSNDSNTSTATTGTHTHKKPKTDQSVHPFFSTPRISYTNASNPAMAHLFTELTVNNSLYVIHYKSPQPSSNIAAFDLDKTLIAPKHGAKFPRHKDDWVLLFPGTAIHSKLRHLANVQGYKIVLFTNQAGINGDHHKLTDFIHKAKNIACHLDVPMQICIATKKDIFRKPAPGMWDWLVDHGNRTTWDTPASRVPIDPSTSFFVGDAAGRPHGWKRGVKKDFADTDRKFALNVGIAFHTPEEFFLDHPVAPHVLDPKAAGAIGTLKTLLDRDEQVALDLHATLRPLVKTAQERAAQDTLHAAVAERAAACKDMLASDVSVEDDDAAAAAVTQELVVLCGSPASGKSTLATWLHDQCGYQVVNQDTLGSLNACLSACKNALASGSSVVIDNTNPMAKTRKAYLDLALVHGVRARLVHLLTPVELSMHLDVFRSFTSDRARLPPVAFSTFASRFEAPSDTEGFHEVIAIPFVPRFTDPGHRRLVTMWLS